MSSHYKGQCHCGEIKFSFEADEITHGLRCTCSICSRKGALMTPFAIAPEKFHIDAKENSLGCYQFGAGTAKHYFCKTCGIYPFHITARQPGHYRANIGCIEGQDTFTLTADIFDGKNML
jgi:hypothetical protein